MTTTEPADRSPALSHVASWGVISDLANEVERAELKFGRQLEMPSFATMSLTRLGARNPFYGMPTEEVAKMECQGAAEQGWCTWGHVLAEEVAEAYNAPTLEELRAELIQVAAVALRWCEAIDHQAQAVT